MPIDWSKKRVLVTGGTGMIGSVLVEELLARGATVRVPTRADNYRALSTVRAQIEWMEGDLRDPTYCYQLLLGVDHVFHLASHRRNVEFHHNHCSDVLLGNVHMTSALIQGMKELGGDKPHVTYFSTANVPPTIDVIHIAQNEVNDGYVLGKALAETLWFAATQQFGFPLLVLRPIGAYGERDTFTAESNVIPSLLVQAHSATSVLRPWGSGKQERAFLYVNDLVNATLLLLDNKATGIQYIVPPTVVTVRKLAEMIRDLVNPKLTIAFDTSKPDGHRSLAALPMHKCLKDFAWTPVQEGLKRTYIGWQNKADEFRGAAERVKSKKASAKTKRRVTA